MVTPVTPPSSLIKNRDVWRPLLVVPAAGGCFGVPAWQESIDLADLAEETNVLSSGSSWGSSPTPSPSPSLSQSPSPTQLYPHPHPHPQPHPQPNSTPSSIVRRRTQNREPRASDVPGVLTSSSVSTGMAWYRWDGIAMNLASPIFGDIVIINQNSVVLTNAAVPLTFFVIFYSRSVHPMFLPAANLVIHMGFSENGSYFDSFCTINIAIFGVYGIPHVQT